MKYVTFTVVMMNLVAMVLAYVIAMNLDIKIGTYIDYMFKIFDCYYVLEVFAKLGVYVIFAENKWKYLKNKVFMMEVAIGIFHLFDLIYWEPNRATRILRLFFVLRILTLMTSIREFTVYIIQSLPALILIVACFFTIFLGYSVMGMELFGTVNTYRCRYLIKSNQINSGTCKRDLLAGDDRPKFLLLRQRQQLPDRLGVRLAVRRERVCGAARCRRRPELRHYQF